MHRKRIATIRLALIAAAMAAVTTLFMLVRTPETVQRPGDQATGTRRESTSSDDRSAVPGAAATQPPTVPTPASAFRGSREGSLLQDAPPIANGAMDGQLGTRNPARPGTQADPVVYCMDDLYPNAPSPASWQSYPKFASQARGRPRVVTDEVWNGSQSAYVSYLSPGSGGRRGFLWQAVDAKPLQGKRVEVAAWVRVLERDVPYGFSMFAQVLSGPSLEIRRSNNSKAQVQGAFPGARSWPAGYTWTRRAVYADVPMDANALLYGMSTTGWVDDVRVSVVGEAEDIGVDQRDTVFVAYGIGTGVLLPVTANMILPAPANLDFEEPAIADPSAGVRRNCADAATRGAGQAVDAVP